MVTIRLDEATFPYGIEMYPDSNQQIFFDDKNLICSIEEALDPETNEYKNTASKTEKGEKHEQTDIFIRA